jgi:hypothetical protein
VSTTTLVRLVTSAGFPDLAVEDQELLVELRSRGIRTEAAVWDDPSVDWAEAGLCVLRSVYDYHLRRDEFLAWVDVASTRTVLRNDAETIRWNSHKSYLTELEQAGLPVIETVWLDPAGSVDLGVLCKERGWSDAVVKPAVSASAHETLMFSARDPEAAQRHAERLLDQGDVMVQPYLHEIERTGETSVIWLGGRRTHAARRPSGLHSTIEEARAGTPVVPTREEVELATRVYEIVEPTPLYARVDIVETESRGLLLLELELVEPALYLRHSPAAVSVFADGIVRLLERGD